MEGNNKGLTWFLLLLFKKKKWGEWGRQREKGRIRWKKRRWFKLLMDLKQTEFGNQFLSDSWFGRTSLVWIKEIGKKKKRKDLLMLTAFPQALFHLFRNWKCFPTPSWELSTKIQLRCLGLHFLGMSVHTARSMVSVLLIPEAGLA